MMKQNFLEIHTPKLTCLSSSGDYCFKLKYFEMDAYLSPSPQLFKQMAIMSDFERVYEIGPVFKYENCLNPKYLCEFTRLDFEMEIKESY